MFDLKTRREPAANEVEHDTVAYKYISLAPSLQHSYHVNHGSKNTNNGAPSCNPCLLPHIQRKNIVFFSFQF